MNLIHYTQLWELVHTQMAATLIRLHSEIKNDPQLAEVFQFLPVTQETNTEDFFVSLIILDKQDEDKTPVVAIDFKLHDEPAGANVTLRIDIISEQSTEWLYSPYNYSAKCLTLDGAELQRRVEDMPFNELLIATRSVLLQLAQATPA
jgi:hypothetical protein